MPAEWANTKMPDLTLKNFVDDVRVHHMFSQFLNVLFVIVFSIKITAILEFYNLFWSLNKNPFRTDEIKRHISWKKFRFHRFRIRENMLWTRYRARPRLRKPSKQSMKLSTLRIWHFILLDLTCLWAYDILSYGCTMLTRLNVTRAPTPASNILTLSQASIGQWTENFT